MKRISIRSVLLIAGVLCAIAFVIVKKDSKDISAEANLSPNLEGEGQFRFFQSLAISATGEDLDVKILKDSFDILSSEKTGTKVVIDLDGLTNLGTPFILYANPRLDITDQVKSAYQDLAKKDMGEASLKDPDVESR